MPEDAAVMDAAPVDVAPVDTGSDVAVDDGQQVDEGHQQEQQQTDDKPVDQAADKLTERAVTPDGRNLTPTAKAALDKMRTENPKLANIFRDALFAESRMKAVFPGGLQEAKAISQTVQQLGGVEGIKGIQTELQGWSDFDAKYTAGDPAAIDFMMSDEVSKAAFLKLAPVAFNKFAEANPEGYASYVSQAIYSDIARNELPTALRMMEFCLSKGDVEGLKEPFELLKGWFAAIKDTAQKPVTAKEPVKAQPDNQIQELQSKVDTAERTTWRGESAQQSQGVFSSEWNKLAAGRKLTDVQSAAVKELFDSRFSKALKQHSPKLDSYFAARDKDGYLKYCKHIDGTEIGKALRSAFDSVLPSRPGPKAGALADKAAPVVKTPVQPGFVMGTRPSNSEIDWKHPFNTTANIKNGKAVLNGGVRRQWTPGLQTAR